MTPARPRPVGLDAAWPRLAPGVIFWDEGVSGRVQRLDGSASHTLNSSAVEVLRHCHGRSSLEDIAGAVARRFGGAPAATVAADVLEFVRWAAGAGLIQLSDGGAAPAHAPVATPSPAPARPTTAYLSLTGRCNLRCAFCYARPPAATADDLALPQWRAILDRLADFMPPGATLVFTGGEPTLHPAFASIAAAAARLSFRLQMYTNGTLIDDECARVCARLGFEVVGASIHGASPAIADAISGVPGSFDRATRAVAALAAAGVPVAWQATITRQNRGEVRAMARLARDLGAAHFRAGTVDFAEVVGGASGGARCGESLSAAEEAGLWDVMSELARELAGQMRVGLATDPCPDVPDRPALPRATLLPTSTCGIGRTVCHVRPDGHLTPCPVLARAAWDLGDVLASDIAGLWEGTAGTGSPRPLRPLRVGGLEDLGRCGACGLRAYCRGGCRAGAFFTTGDIAGCDVKRARAIRALLAGEGGDAGV